MIEFKEETHQYFVNGQEYPSVTTILSSLNNFAFVNSTVLKNAAEFGTAVHKATELYDSNNLDLDLLDESVLSYVEGWAMFLDEYQPDILSSEHRVSSKYGYAGTLDRYAVINNKKIVIDIKSGTTVPKTTALQLAAYQQAIIENGGTVDCRYAVHLQPNKFKVIPFNNHNDFNVFKSALNIYRWQNL